MNHRLILFFLFVIAAAVGFMEFLSGVVSVFCGDDTEDFVMLLSCGTATLIAGSVGCAVFRPRTELQRKAGLREGLAPQPGGELAGAGNDDAGGSGQQRQADEERGHRLEFAVAVIMVGVLRFGADVHENQHDDVGDEVRHRMRGVRHHGSTVRQDASNELDGHQAQIAEGAHQRHATDRLFPLHGR